MEVFRRESFTNLSSIKVGWENWSWMAVLGVLSRDKR